MSKTAPQAAPPDQLQRDLALDSTRSVLVQAPAGSGKTTLLTERFLTLLIEVDEPGQVVAITFTNAAAAEMRSRLLDELRAPDPSPIARRVLDRSELLGWRLLDLPAQLRISTIDSFCRDLALQQPLLSSLGGGLAIAEQPTELYRRAARRTIEQIGVPNSTAISEAVATLLEWQDNNWHELENLLVDMLSTRDRWMQEFVLSKEPDWEALRARLERPFATAIRSVLDQIVRLLDQAPGACDEALLLARFACSQPSGEQHRALAELVEFPSGPFGRVEALEEAHEATQCLANLLLTKDGGFRRRVDTRHGFPTDRKAEKARLINLIQRLDSIPGLEDSLASVCALPPIRYTEDDWMIVRACFTLLRHAAGELKVVFAEAATVDFIEVAQVAESVLKGNDGFPSDAAFAVADGIRHLLVDEFQDTSRRQHQLLANLIAAWPDREGRTLFLVGDPMQSIYFFRDADAELFPRVNEMGLEIPNADPLKLRFVSLFANFRTAHSLVDRLNGVFAEIFAVNDGSGVEFSEARPAREALGPADTPFQLHLDFRISAALAQSEVSQDSQEDPAADQVGEIVELIRSHQPAIDKARAAGKKYRVAVLGRTRSSLAPIAVALHEAAIPFRAVDLEKLGSRAEVLDALALARALLNPFDRVAWLGVLRAPWCGLGLDDLHTLSSADDPAILGRPIPDLLAERSSLLSPVGRIDAERVLAALALRPTLEASQPGPPRIGLSPWGGEPTASLGTWLQQVWVSLGGEDCYDATAGANLDLCWRCLDRLPGGRQDLLSPALDAALDKLTALPDPQASIDCGVQLMTIHKSKGLEFEVVIVSDLQAKTGAHGRKLLSWLERGLQPGVDADYSDPEPEGEITEFLIAPLPLKGEDAGKSKAWVDRVYRQREAQETRRILYVAATRAREELHLFARPAVKVEANGQLSLVRPSASLLATAWPAFEEEIQARFEAWKSARRQTALALEPQPDGEIVSLAASAERDLFAVDSSSSRPTKPTILRRLPQGYRVLRDAPSSPHPLAPALDGQQANASVSFQYPKTTGLYDRHEGGLLSRAIGTAVHTLLEELTRLRAASDWPVARSGLRHREARIASQVRATGIAPRQAEEIGSKALQLALDVSNDPIGQWILAPHVGAASEVRWSGVLAGSVRTVQADRVFQAGLIPQTDGQESWWIIDYKTHARTPDFDPASALPQLRELFAPQLEAYGAILRAMHGSGAVIRAGLYYPRMLLLDWWEL
ncbi:MAG: UvrD-helicase domain-containing protein [Terracidiphilus sp.]